MWMVERRLSVDEPRLRSSGKEGCSPGLGKVGTQTPSFFNRGAKKERISRVVQMAARLNVTTRCVPFC